MTFRIFSGQAQLGKWLNMHLLALLAIVLLGIVLRLHFFTGMVRGDDFNYAHTAYELAQGRSPLGIWAGSPRIGLYAPVSLLYLLFGPSEVTTLAYPFMMSIISILLIYSLGRMLAAPQAGLLAAWLWSMFPLDIFLASDLLPDGLVAAFSTAAVLFLLLALRSFANCYVLWLFLCLACIGWAILIKPIAIISLIFILGYFGFYLYKNLVSGLISKVQQKLKISPSNRLLLIIILASVALFLYSQLQTRPFLVTLARTAYDTSQLIMLGTIDYEIPGVNQVAGNLLYTNLFIPLAPLFLVAIIYFLFVNRAELDFPLFWFGSLFLIYEWASVSLNPLVYKPIESFVEGRSALFLFVPLCIIAGGYLSSLLERRFAEYFLFGLSLAVAFLVLAPNNLLLDLEQRSYLSMATVLVAAFALLSPYLQSMDIQGYKTIIGSVFLTLLAIALLSPSPPFHASSYLAQREGLENLRLAADELSDDSNLRIHTNAPLQMNYASDFYFGHDWANTGLGQFRIFATSASEKLVGDVVVILGQTGEVPSGWVLNQSFGKDPQSSVSLFTIVEQP